MEVTGYQLREALKQWGLRKAALDEVFKDSLFAFKGDTKESPSRTSDAIGAAEGVIVSLQVAQMRYNLALTIEAPTLGTLTLAEATKLAGAMDRLEKMWREASSKKTSYYGSEMVRESSQERATATITPREVLACMTDYSKKASLLRAAIAAANAQKVDLKDLQPSFFE